MTRPGLDQRHATQKAVATLPEDLDHSTVDPANLALGDQYHAVVPQMIGRIRQTPDTG